MEHQAIMDFVLLDLEQEAVAVVFSILAETGISVERITLARTEHYLTLCNEKGISFCRLKFFGKKYQIWLRAIPKNRLKKLIESHPLFGDTVYSQKLFTKVYVENPLDILSVSDLLVNGYNDADIEVCIPTKEDIEHDEREREKYNIDFYFSKLREMDDIHDDNILIAKCFEMFPLVEAYLQYCKESNLAICVYNPYARAAKIFEKQKNYQEAVSICDQAIAVGYVIDGTKGGMIGRRERLQKKVEKSD